jgi:hypothetical protein
MTGIKRVATATHPIVIAAAVVAAFIGLIMATRERAP